MTLQQDRANGASGLWTDSFSGDPLEELTVEELTVEELCAEDCHFCRGPETD